MSIKTRLQQGLLCGTLAITAGCGNGKYENAYEDAFYSEVAAYDAAHESRRRIKKIVDLDKQNLARSARYGCTVLYDNCTEMEARYRKISRGISETIKKDTPIIDRPLARRIANCYKKVEACYNGIE